VLCWRLEGLKIHGMVHPTHPQIHASNAIPTHTTKQAFAWTPRTHINKGCGPKSWKRNLGKVHGTVLGGSHGMKRHTGHWIAPRHQRTNQPPNSLTSNCSGVDHRWEWHPNDKQHTHHCHEPDTTLVEIYSLHLPALRS